jgi:hypothetical protein
MNVESSDMYVATMAKNFQKNIAYKELSLKILAK